MSRTYRLSNRIQTTIAKLLIQIDVQESLSRIKISYEHRTLLFFVNSSILAMNELIIYCDNCSKRYLANNGSDSIFVLSSCGRVYCQQCKQSQDACLQCTSRNCTCKQITECQLDFNTSIFFKNPYSILLKISMAESYQYKRMKNRIEYLNNQNNSLNVPFAKRMNTVDQTHLNFQQTSNNIDQFSKPLVENTDLQDFENTVDVTGTDMSFRSDSVVSVPLTSKSLPPDIGSEYRSSRSSTVGQSYPVSNYDRQPLTTTIEQVKSTPTIYSSTPISGREAESKRFSSAYFNTQSPSSITSSSGRYRFQRLSSQRHVYKFMK